MADPGLGKCVMLSTSSIVVGPQVGAGPEAVNLCAVERVCFGKYFAALK